MCRKSFYRGIILARLKAQSRSSGFTIIGLLIVVVVIAILSGYYFQNGGSEQQSASQYQQTMDRSKATACLASRTALHTSVMSWSMQHGNQQPTPQELQQAGININVCPEGGKITIAQDGTLKCSIHNP